MAGEIPVDLAEGVASGGNDGLDAETELGEEVVDEEQTATGDYIRAVVRPSDVVHEIGASTCQPLVAIVKVGGRTAKAVDCQELGGEEARQALALAPLGARPEPSLFLGAHELLYHLRHQHVADRSGIAAAGIDADGEIFAIKAPASATAFLGDANRYPEIDVEHHVAEPRAHLAEVAFGRRDDLVRPRRLEPAGQ